MSEGLESLDYEKYEPQPSFFRNCSTRVRAELHQNDVHLAGPPESLTGQRVPRSAPWSAPGRPPGRPPVGPSRPFVGPGWPLFISETEIITPAQLISYHKGGVANTRRKTSDPDCMAHGTAAAVCSRGRRSRWAPPARASGACARVGGSSRGRWRSRGAP